MKKKDASPPEKGSCLPADGAAERKTAAPQNKWLAGLLAVLICLALGCWIWSISRGEVVLRVGFFVGSNWGVPSGEAYAVMDAAIEKFEAEHPGVKVEYVSGIKREDYGEWLAEQLLAGEEPDVFLVQDADFDAYASIGILHDLTEFVSRDQSFDWEGYYPAVADYGRYEGQVYALPLECAPTLMFVNKTLLAREGIAMPREDWTWGEFYDICAKVTRDTDGDGALDQFGVYGYDWQLAALANGAELFRGDGKASYFADARMEAALHFLLRLRDLQRGRQVTSRDFDLGRVAFRPFTFAEYRTYKPYPWRIKKLSDSEWDCVRLPKGPQGSNDSPVGTLLLGMSGRTSNGALAWEFMREASTDPEIQRLILDKSQGLPVRRQVVQEAAREEALAGGGESGMDLAEVSDIMDEAVSPPKFRDREAAILMADNEIQRILQGKEAVGGALHRLQKEINAYLQR